MFFARSRVKSFPGRYIGGALEVFGPHRSVRHQHRQRLLVRQATVMQRSDAVPGRVFGGPDIVFQAAQRSPFRIAAAEFLRGNRTLGVRY